MARILGSSTEVTSGLSLSRLWENVMQPMTDRTTLHHEALLLLTALTARLLVPILASGFHDISYFVATDDSHEYLGLAESLTEGSFSMNGVAEVMRTPGYPLLVALGVLAGHPIGFTILLQVVLGGAAAVIVYALALHVAEYIGCRDSRRVALLAGLFYALDPLSVIFSSFLLSETLFTTLLIAHLFVLSKYFETGLMRHVALSGVFAAASAFVRPVAQYWPFVVVAVLLLHPAPKQVERPFARFASALVFVMVTLTPLMLWAARNTYETGYSGFSAAGDYGLYVSLGSSVADTHRNAAKQRLDMLAMRNGWTAAERYDYMRREGLRVIVDRPLTYLAVHCRAILQSLTPAFSMYVEIYRPGYADASTWRRLFGGTSLRLWDHLPALPVYLLVGLACATQYVLALAGMRRALVSRSGLNVLLLASSAYFLIMAGAVGDIATARMRHPAMPAICVLAGLGASAAIRRYWSREASEPGT